MKPIAIELPTARLKAAMLCASTEQMRYYLNGVLASKDGWLASTDGHRLFASKHGELLALPEDIIIPLVTLKTALAKAKAGTVLLLRRDGRWLLNVDGAEFGFTPIDGTFPDWQRVVPTEPKGGPAHFNPRYVADVGKMAKLLGLSDLSYHITHDPSGPCAITFGTLRDCFSVLMPVRAGAVEWDRAAFLAPPEPVEVAAAA